MEAPLLSTKDEKSWVSKTMTITFFGIVLTIIVLLLASLLVWLLVLQPANTSSDVGPNNQSTNIVYCQNPPPGLSAMSRGVDITKLDLMPLDTLTDNGFGRRVIELTCNQKRKWTSPFEAKETYDLPDQVEAINAIPGGVVDASYSAFRDYRNIKTSMAASAGVGFLNGMFSASGSYKHAQHSITNTSKMVATLEGHFSALQADFVASWEHTLNGSAKSFIEKLLPNQFTDDPDSFFRFIDIFGTHYLSSGKLGGIYKLTIDIESSLTYQMSDRDIETNAKGTFFNFLSANGAYQGSVTKISEQFQSRSEMTSRYFGGNANLFAAANWQTWWPTVPGNPWLYGGKLEPITDLLVDGPKKQAIKKAVQVYLDKAYLQEMQRMLNSFLGKGRVGEERASQFAARVGALLAQVIPDSAAVASLGEQIHEFLTAPDWFVKQTNICYHWYPDGDAGQCTGAARDLCAATNQMTAFYRDDSDKRGGGCRMSWGLTTAGAPAWFGQAQLCFRWQADGDPRQCGGGAPTEMCAPVGASTGWYRDDTDNRGGGCLMSWRLLVPADAPSWLLNAKLCFNWVPDGDPNQCGAGAAQLLCAVANQWTQFYRDDTDSRGGGCLMHWGLKTLS